MQTWKEREPNQEAFLEIMRLQNLVDAIDQLRADAPADIKVILGVAWWYAERQLRELTGGECSQGGHLHAPKKCAWCKEFEDLRPAVLRWKG